MLMIVARNQTKLNVKFQKNKKHKSNNFHVGINMASKKFI